MKTVSFISWNVNGIRAIAKKGFLDFVKQESPDFLCLQEIKAQEDQIPSDLKLIDGYTSYFFPGDRKGYSGVAIYAKKPALQVSNSIGEPLFDREGRNLFLEYPEFVLGNIYFPNGQSGSERLKYKLDYYEHLLKFLPQIQKQGKALILCGDVNTAHKEIDLFHPKENAKTSGFLPVERAWLDKFLASGFEDVFRVFNREAHQYTYWDVKSRARERNVGWRIDYFFIDSAHKNNLVSAELLPQVMGSDHCPVKISVRI